MKRFSILFSLGLIFSPLFFACQGDKSTITQSELFFKPEPDRLGRGELPDDQDQNQIAVPGGGNQPQGGPEVFVPGGPEPVIVQVRPSSPEAPPEESPPAEPSIPYEVISQAGSRDVEASSCFDFSVKTISGGNSIPMVVYEQKLLSSRKLVFAERSGGVWRQHLILTLSGDDIRGWPDCMFKPVLFIDAEGQLYVTADDGTRLRLFARSVTGSWVDISPESESVGSSNISVREVGGILKMVYRAPNNHPRISCYSFAAPLFCTREINTIIPDATAHLVLLPWIWEEDDEDCEKVLRFAGTDEDVRDVLILKFCGERNEVPAIHLGLSEGIKNPFFAMGPGEDRFAIVYAQPGGGNLIRFCQFNSEGEMVSGSCENIGASGKHPSIAVQTDGKIAISYTFQNGLRLSKKNPGGGWDHDTLVRNSRFDIGKSSIVQLAPVGGVVQTQIVYTAYDYAAKITTLRFSPIP